ncbi:MAG: chemotaxis protein CheY [Verrucomicrobiales bacterium]|nr:chemotaxis protein CheY [Verrucomicrobiales bacterium]
MNKKRPILIVEDCEEDIDLLEIAIRKAKITAQTQVVRNGQEAIDYLHGLGKFSDRQSYPFPGVIFLDLKMPRLNGFDVLEDLKGHEHCKIVPVMLLTASALDEDVIRAYQLGANCYMQKPATLEELVALVDLAFRFWGACVLPPVLPGCE